MYNIVRLCVDKPVPLLNTFSDHLGVYTSSMDEICMVSKFNYKDFEYCTEYIQ